MKFLGKVARNDPLSHKHVKSLLHTSTMQDLSRGRPLSKASLIESLKRFGEYNCFYVYMLTTRGISNILICWSSRRISLGEMYQQI